MEEDDDIMELIEKANVAHIKSNKEKVLGAVVFNKSMDKKHNEYMNMENDIYLALKEKSFSFYLQPKVDLLTGEIVGAEALPRRLSSYGTMIYPDIFLPIMETNGSIIELDLLILQKVCEFMADRIQKKLPVVSTSINLSCLHIRKKNTAEILHSIIQEYEIPPKLLKFEITEAIPIEEFSEAKLLIDKLRSLNYSVLIDDFGSGYAGINVWQELNFDYLKLDKKFLSDDELLKTKNSAIIPNIINIAQKLNISVICEGVERADQCRYLLGLGCRYAQGFYFLPPVAPNQFYNIYKQLNGYYLLPYADLKKIHESYL